MAKQYFNVNSMISDISDDKEFNKSLEKELYARRLSRILAAMRNEKNLSEEDVAKKMGVSKEEIEKIESSRDSVLNIGSIAQYSGAVGMRVEIGFTDKRLSTVDQVKYHYFRIKILLEKLLKMCKGDKDMEIAASKFTKEVFANITMGLLEYVQRAELEEAKTKEKKEEGTLFISPPANFAETQNQTVIH
jgi:transcriptional regulator with XRE-family HTH domain